MAQKPLSTAAAERMNLVAQDEIWKYRLKAEGEARQNWAQNWGFLTTPVEELLKGEEEPPTLKPKIELPQRFRIRPVTPVEKYIKSARTLGSRCGQTLDVHMQACVRGSVAFLFSCRTNYTIFSVSPAPFISEQRMFKVSHLRT
ncbi:ciliary microtubule inner protein 1 isoform 1-T1 [Lycaon pictus]